MQVEVLELAALVDDWLLIVLCSIWYKTDTFVATDDRVISIPFIKDVDHSNCTDVSTKHNRRRGTTEIDVNQEEQTTPANANPSKSKQASQNQLRVESLWCDLMTVQIMLHPAMVHEPNLSALFPRPCLFLIFHFLLLIPTTADFSLSKSSCNHLESREQAR